MHGLFFEMQPKDGHLPQYFAHVDRLRPILAQHKGLAYLERFGAVENPDQILSHQLWQTEADILAWRQDAQHRRSQYAGISTHFADYRIRVGERVAHWQQGQTVHSSLPQPDARLLLAIYGPAPCTSVQYHAYESFTNRGHFLSLASFDAPGAAHAALIAQAGQGATQASIFAIARDYGQFDRAEAPTTTAQSPAALPAPLPAPRP